jgi:chromosome partitioning protein
VKVWTVANQKGGVGKTTTAVALAGLLAQRGSRVLLVDFDPHGSLTVYFGFDPDTVDPSVYTLFQRAEAGARAPAAACLRRTRFDRIALLPASTALVSLDRQLGARGGMGLVLREALLHWKNLFDHVVIDCPPTLGILMVNALAACERLIAPVQTEFLALKGLERLVYTLSMVRRSRPVDAELLVVPTMFDRRTRAGLQCLKTLQTQHGEHLWPRAIPIDNRVREASQQGVPVTQLYPYTRASLAYAHLLNYLETGRDGEGHPYRGQPVDEPEQGVMPALEENDDDTSPEDEAEDASGASSDTATTASRLPLIDAPAAETALLATRLRDLPFDAEQDPLPSPWPAAASDATHAVTAEGTATTGRLALGLNA